jgi:hypothetical protein
MQVGSMAEIFQQGGKHVNENIYGFPSYPKMNSKWSNEQESLQKVSGT